jgi:spermidine/putrescine transport system permease protein
MKKIKLILIVLTGVFIMPIFSLLHLSFQNTSGNFLKWYYYILSNSDFLISFLNSFIISLINGVSTMILGFILSISYFSDKSIRTLTIFFILVTGLMPPDIVSLSINKLAHIFGVYKSNIFFLFFSLLLYCLPFSIIILWTRYYFIDKNILIVSKDIGMSNNSIILKVLMPLSNTALISTFMFAFLLSFNEYPRTFYLSGSTIYLSEYLNGKLSSGTDNSIYAGGTITILTSCCIILVYGLVLKLKYKLDQRRIVN